MQQTENSKYKKLNYSVIEDLDKLLNQVGIKRQS